MYALNIDYCIKFIKIIVLFNLLYISIYNIENIYSTHLVNTFIQIFKNELASRQSQQVVCGILDDILASIQSPERPRSPVDAYITEEETFNRKNPMVSYITLNSH